MSSDVTWPGGVGDALDALIWVSSVRRVGARAAWVSIQSYLLTCCGYTWCYAFFPDTARSNQINRTCDYSSAYSSASARCGYSSASANCCRQLSAWTFMEMSSG